jgi:hypothetical protein
MWPDSVVKKLLEEVQFNIFATSVGRPMSFNIRQITELPLKTFEVAKLPLMLYLFIELPLI